MSRNIVFEGWLTKSPPTKRIWRTKWRRRWFALRHSGELPGQYFLDYYADRNCRRLKGTINLDLCEQVDAGLHMERSGSGSLDPKLRGSVFTIQTQSRTYHLEADCEADMAKWVDAICSVCGLRSTEDPSTEVGTYQNNMGPIAVNEQYECPDGTGPYIRISECITGMRAQDSRAFTFDTKNIVTSSRRPFEMPNSRAHQMYLSQSLRPNNTEFSENESNLSDEECKSLNASQSNIGDWSVTKSFTKLAVDPNKNGFPDDGPPVPPRPPKTLAVSSKNHLQKDAYLGPKYNEPVEATDNVLMAHNLGVVASQSAARRMSHGAPPSPARGLLPPSAETEDEDEYSPGHPLMQYCNVKSLPPAVDRALKPRPSSHSISHLNSYNGQCIAQIHFEEARADTLQYLDLDLQTPKSPTPKTPKKVHRKKLEIAHGKSLSEVDADADSCYKTVDFLKTEAFNITMQDAEASRSHHTQHLNAVGQHGH